MQLRTMNLLIAMGWIALGVGGALATRTAVGATPLQLDPANPHYFLFQGKPTVLIGSSEHYGSVMNRDFNYVRYLDTLKANDLNVTRLFSGQYHERPGEFRMLSAPSDANHLEIVENTLAPNVNAYIAPWPRSIQPGALDGRNKFDLGRWNDEYFDRLLDFVRQADQRGIIVEVSLFSPYYVNAFGNYLWEISPWNTGNNINGIGSGDGGDVLSLKDAKLLAVQEALVRKILNTLSGFGNVYYEICNEPDKTDVPMDWQAHFAHLIVQTEGALGVRHLIAQEFADTTASNLAAEKDPAARSGMRTHAITARLPEASLLAFHSSPPRVVLDNYENPMPIGQNESVFLFGDAVNRFSAWRILLAGGSFHHGTDYSFTRGHEDGSFIVPANGAGGGSPALRRQLSVLHAFMDGLDFIKMKPAPTVIKTGVPPGALALVLAEQGRSYAIYVSHERSAPGTKGAADVDSSPQRLSLQLDIPPGDYTARWINTKTGAAEHEQRFSGGKRARALASPPYTEDIALVVAR